MRNILTRLSRDLKTTVVQFNLFLSSSGAEAAHTPLQQNHLTAYLRIKTFFMCIVHSFN